MDCKEVRPMIHGYVDEEIDAVTMARIESHATNCANCQQLLRNQKLLRARIKTSSPYYTAPAGLEKTIRGAIRGAKKQTWPLFLDKARWLTVGAIASSAAMLSVSLTLFLTSPFGDELLAREAISDHVRSLMADHLTDIQSTDQHTVKPWFVGQLDFSPPVTNLASSGFLLVGGRMDYLNNRQVAALAYECRKHVINLFISPTAEHDKLTIKTHRWQGYESYEWTQSGMHFWAVSDVKQNDLAQFAHLLQSSAATSTVK
jgi:anti-sigma factor RsiW